MTIPDFGLFCLQYTPLVRKVVARTLGGRHEADVDDLVQETFLYFYERLEKFTNDSGPINLLKKCAVHRTLDFLRSRQAIEHSELVDVASVDNRTEVVESVEEIRESFQALPAEDRMLLFYRFWQGYTLIKCARLMGSDKSTVGRRLNRALRRLHAKHPNYPSPNFAPTM